MNFQGNFKLEGCYLFQHLQGYGGAYTYPIVFTCATVNGTMSVALTFSYPKINMNQIDNFMVSLTQELDTI